MQRMARAVASNQSNPSSKHTYGSTTGGQHDFAIATRKLITLGALNCPFAPQLNFTAGEGQYKLPYISELGLDSFRQTAAAELKATPTREAG